MGTVVPQWQAVKKPFTNGFAVIEWLVEFVFQLHFRSFFFKENYKEITKRGEIIS